MLLSAIYRILCVACLLCTFQLCCATDEVVDEQTARRICMENCSHLTKDVFTTQLSSEVRNLTGESRFLSLEDIYVSGIDYYNQMKDK